MESKISYEELDLEVIRFDSEDIITNSKNCPTEGEIVGG